jgi:steroid delta-isomerase-like uncharacterized protein
LLDSVNAHDLDKWRACLADDFTASYPSLRDDGNGGANGGVNGEVAYNYNAVIMAAMPDLHFDVQRTVVNGDVVVYQWMASATQTGALTMPTGTIPPTGKRASAPGVLIAVVKNGKIVREETYWNQLEVLAQLGAM